MDMIGAWLLDIGPYHWLALAAVLIGLEMVMPTQYLIWPGIAAIITGLIAFVAHVDWATQLAIFAVFSVVLVVVSHYVPQGRLGPQSTTPLNQRTDQLVGRTAIVADDFTNGHGPVTVGDTRWQAQSVDGTDLTAGTRVQIVAAESTLLKVKGIGARA